MLIKMPYCCIYLTNRACLLAASSSITWHCSSQHLFRLGSLLLGYHELLLPKQSQRSSATLRCSPWTCESPSLLSTVSLWLTCSSSPRLVLYLRWLLALSLFFCPLTVHSLWAPSFFLPLFFFTVPPSCPALDSLSVFCWVWVCDSRIHTHT